MSGPVVTVVRRPADLAAIAIDQLGDRLRALTPADPDRYGVSVLGRRAPVRAAQAQLTAGWWPVSDPGALIAAMRSGHGRHLSISPAVAGATMVASLAGAAAGRLAVALAVAAAAYDTGPDSLAVKLDAGGLVQRIAVRRRTLLVLPGDPLATSTMSPVVRIATAGGDVRTVPDRAALVAWAARRVLATLDPLIGQLHRATRYGRVPMWNLVADAVLGPATVAPRLAGLDQSAGRAIGVALVDALVDLGAPIHRYGTVREQVGAQTAPGPQATAGPQVGAESQAAAGQQGASVLAPVRGSCCLHYRLTEAKCETCPLLAQRP